MARGNQRELARQKNQKKESSSGKGQRKDEMTHAQRLEHDRKILIEKQAKADAKKAEEAKNKK